MKAKLPLLIALLIGLALGAVLSPLRYSIAANSAATVVYRLDRLTGTVEISVVGEPWEKIEHLTPGEKRLRKLTDEELLQIAAAQKAAK